MKTGINKESTAYTKEGSIVCIDQSQFSFDDAYEAEEFGKNIQRFRNTAPEGPRGMYKDKYGATKPINIYPCEYSRLDEMVRKGNPDGS